MTDRLYRSRDDRMIAGVAGGLAEMWDVDPSLIRIVWALLVPLTGGIALLVYIIMAIVVPDEEDVYPMGAPTGVYPPPPTAPTTPAAPMAEPAPTAGPPTTPETLWSPPLGDVRATRIAARQQQRDARRAARAARGDRGGVPGSVIFGLILVAFGLFFLAREWIPQLDFDWFWPIVLVGLGLVLLFTALRRSDGGGGTP